MIKYIGYNLGMLISDIGIFMASLCLGIAKLGVRIMERYKIVPLG